MDCRNDLVLFTLDDKNFFNNGVIYTNKNMTYFGRIPNSQLLILAYLNQHREKIITVDILLQVGWPSEQVCRGNAIVAIAKLRQLLEKVTICTVRGIGYVLGAERATLTQRYR